jgi:hypothetical protein
LALETRYVLFPAIRIGSDDQPSRPDFEGVGLEVDYSVGANHFLLQQPVRHLMSSDRPGWALAFKGLCGNAMPLFDQLMS